MKLPPGFDLIEDDGKWLVLELGPSGVTTTAYESKEDAEAAIAARAQTRNLT